MAEDGEDSRFKVEYAKSSRSKCYGSKDLIPEGELRVGVMVQHPKADIMIPQWYLVEYFEDIWLIKNPGKLHSESQVGGLEKLKPEDQKRMKAMIKTGDSSNVTQAAPQSKEEKAAEQDAKLIWNVREKIEAEGLRPVDLKNILLEANQPATGKLWGGKDKCLDRLAEAMVFGWLPPCSEAGGPETCNGHLVYSKGVYRCIGDVDEFTKCSFTTTEVEREQWTPPECVDSDFLDNYKFRSRKRTLVAPDDSEAPPKKKQKKQVEESESEDEMDEDEEPFSGLTVVIAGKMSKGLAALKKLIKENGGSVTESSAKADIFVTNKAEAKGKSKKVLDADRQDVPFVTEDWIHKSIELERKMKPAEIKKEGMYLKNEPEGVSVAVVDDEREARRAEARKEAKADAAIQKSIAEQAKLKKANGGEALGLQEGEEYKEANPGQVKKKLKIKGFAAVEPSSGLEDVAKVYDNGPKEVWNATLNKSDVATGKNSYYILQLLEADNKKSYWVFRKWGRMGSTIGDKKLEEFKHLTAARADFEKLYEDKSGNRWSNRHSFKNVPGKMIQLEIDYGEEQRANAKKVGKYEGDLPKSTQQLVDLIFDTKIMESALMEMEIDTAKMPLGKLSRATLMKGYSALKELAKILKDVDSDDEEDDESKNKILGLTNKFYTYVPHAFGDGKKPPILNTLEQVKEKSKMIDSLLEMEITTALLKSGAASNEHPIDANYSKLNCDLEEVKPKSKEFKRLNDFIQNTHAPTHKMYDLELEAAWTARREVEKKSFSEWEEVKNRKLMWHGSRLTNWVGILSQGLRIAPPEAPATGYMFGKGVYFADMSSKSANYCYTTSEKTTGLMMLSEVALGDMYEVTKAEYMDKPPKGYQSTWGQGLTEPDPKGNYVDDEGLEWPMGKAKASTHVDKSNLQYNEFIVYDTKQIRMRYLLKLKFNYKGKFGTFL